MTIDISCMNPTIEQIYDHWFDKTGDPDVASRMVLAQFQSSQPAVSNGQDQAMLKPREVAKQLHVNPSTVINWIQSGELKASNLGRPGKRSRWAIAKKHLESFLENRQPLTPATKKRRSHTNSREFY